MMTSTTTLVTFVLDETGSMQSIKDDTIGGFNEFLSRLKKDGPNTLFTLIKFDSNRQAVVHRAVPIQSMPELTEETYQPGAATPLIDACVKGIQEAERDAREAMGVSIVIQTDGLENASQHYQNSDLAAMVKEKRKRGWMFTFLGAGIDAFAQAGQFGIAPEDTLRYGRDKSHAAFRVTAHRNVDLMELGEARGFSSAERELARDDSEATAPGRATGESGRQSSLFRED